MNRCKEIRKRIRDRYKTFTQALEEDFFGTMLITTVIIIVIGYLFLFPYRWEQWGKERRAEEKHRQEIQTWLKMFDEMESDKNVDSN